MSKKSIAYQLLASISLLALIAGAALAQASSFTYQGRLTESTKPADGLYDMQFKLFDTPTVGTGTQQGATITNSTVQVTNAVFAVELDFGAGVFDGSPRFLEISVRSTGSPDPYTVLAPRQPISATPYAIRSATAANAILLGGVAAGGFIQNGTTQQPGTSFNISGDGTLAGTLSAGIVNAGVGYNINGNRVLSSPLGDNLFAGIGAGMANTAGEGNSFFGVNAGESNTLGSFNSFFGLRAGVNNTTGSDNSFFGVNAGFSNEGSFNSFFGSIAGQNNTTGTSNAFFGTRSGFANTTGSFNSFFGNNAGAANLTGGNNAFFGAGAGLSNTTGGGNSFFGSAAGLNNTMGFGNSFFGLRTGQHNTSGNNNSFFGVDAGLFNTTGAENSFFGLQAGAFNQTGGSNSFFGAFAGFANTTGFANSFYGVSAGKSNTEGNSNSFFGQNAGLSNNTGIQNSFYGVNAGQRNTTGGGNSFYGINAGFFNTAGDANSFFGQAAGQANTTACCNSFFGTIAGFSNTSGSNNAFFGASAGQNNTTGMGNTSVGGSAGLSNTTENNNTFIGANSNGAAGISNATALGAGATVSASNTIVLGRSGGLDTVRIPGSLVVTGTVSKGGGSFKIDHPLDPENKTLSHSFVESPDMMNIYNGNAVLDRRGEAVVTLPDYFQALNRDFRYQLTCIGGFAPVYIAREIRGNSFKIAGGKPGMKVSWQVTGVRQDAYANAHRIPVEQNKPAAERGTYLHPDAFDKDSTKQARTKQAGGMQR
jgi:hypothetical protein